LRTVHGQKTDNSGLEKQVPAWRKE
jgi:hypothetical protein